MFRKRKLQLILAALILLASGLFAVFWQTPAVDADSAKSAPDFTITDIYGETFSLSGLEGKVVLIDFWATWCGFCRASVPILNSLYADYKDKGLEIISISSESERVLRQFAEERDIIYVVAADKANLSAEYGVYSIPTRFLINRKGQIVQKTIGFQEKEDLEAVLDKLL